MNISDVNATRSHRSDHLKNGNVGNSNPVDPSSQGASSSDAKSLNAGDRVEISDKARSALAEARQSEELSFARKALDNVPSLSEERIAELKDRIQSGHYQQPDVLGEIAKGAASELSGGRL